MGKKSKRRGGTGGGKKSRHTAGAGDAGGSSVSFRDRLTAAAASGAAGPGVTPVDAIALLETVPPPPSFKGIVSTNDDPGKCAICFSPAKLGDFYSAHDISLAIIPRSCCGKRFCNACARADVNCGLALDLLGERRCTFCNCRDGDQGLKIILSREPWAHYSVGIVHCLSENSMDTSKAFDCMVQAARQGHPEAFLRLSELCLGKYEHPRDLVAAHVFAKKARSFHPDLRLISNKGLLDIAEDYSEDGAVEEAMGILSNIAKEADPDALDGELCGRIATAATRIKQFQLSSKMWVSAFYHGEIESAICASEAYTCTDHYALSKLWLSVACKTSSGFHSFTILDDDGTGNDQMFWSSPKFKQRRDKLRSKLREISDSCGGCGAVLEGDTRQYCRGCKAFCYCSRECQKLHWNRADGGHRAECKEAQDQACKILEAIQSGKIDLSKKKE